MLIHGRGPFRIFHPDFAVHNVIFDDEYNLLSLIDWDFAFAGPFELATQQALRHRTYPLPILAKIPGATDIYGNVIDKMVQSISGERSVYRCHVT